MNEQDFMAVLGQLETLEKGAIPKEMKGKGTNGGLSTVGSDPEESVSAEEVELLGKGVKAGGKEEESSEEESSEEESSEEESSEEESSEEESSEPISKCNASESASVAPARKRKHGKTLTKSFEILGEDHQLGEAFDVSPVLERMARKLGGHLDKALVAVDERQAETLAANDKTIRVLAKALRAFGERINDLGKQITDFGNQPQPQTTNRPVLAKSEIASRPFTGNGSDNANQPPRRQIVNFLSGLIRKGEVPAGVMSRFEVDGSLPADVKALVDEQFGQQN